MGRRRESRSDDDPLEAYRKVRKPLPPPSKAVPDRRRKLEERADRRDRREDEP